MEFDHVLLIGFGGPRNQAEVRPFLEQVTRGTRIPEERIREVEHHYEAIGGKSPYNEYTFQLAAKLEERLAQSGAGLPVLTGMRNGHPFLKETLSLIRERGLKRGFAIVLASHRSDASYGKYIRSLEAAQKEAGASEIFYRLADPWHEDPLFIEAQAGQILKVFKNPKMPGLEEMSLIFTAHAIPEAMAKECLYREEFEASSALVAGRLGVPRWKRAYQSRSGNPRDPWLEPDTHLVLEEVRAEGSKNVLFVPIGFLCDNAEVLYDLDIEAAGQARRLGLDYYRASSVMDHPAFVELLAQRIPRQGLRP